MLGVNLTSRDVKECNKRGCFHIHGQAQGGATPELIAFVAEDARLRSRASSATNAMSSGVAPPCAWPWMWKQPRLLHSLTSRLVRLTPSTPFSRSVATESVAICGEEAAGDERLVERLGWHGFSHADERVCS